MEKRVNILIKQPKPPRRKLPKESLPKMITLRPIPLGTLPPSIPMILSSKSAKKLVTYCYCSKHMLFYPCKKGCPICIKEKEEEKLSLKE